MCIDIMIRMNNERTQHDHCMHCLGQAASPSLWFGCHFTEKLMSQLTETIIQFIQNLKASENSTVEIHFHTAHGDRGVFTCLMHFVKSAHESSRCLTGDKHIPMGELGVHVQERPADPTGAVPKYSSYLQSGNLQLTAQHRG